MDKFRITAKVKVVVFEEPNLADSVVTLVGMRFIFLILLLNLVHDQLPQI